MCLSQTSVDSTVRVLSLSRFCPDFPENRVRCLSAVRILSGFAVRCLSVRILSVSILSAVRILSGFLEKTLSGACLSGFLCLNPVRCRDFLKKGCPLSVCPLSEFCPDFLKKYVWCLSGVRILTRYNLRCLSVRYFFTNVSVRLLSGYCPEYCLS